MTQAINDNATDGIGLGRPATQEFDLPNNLINGTFQSTPFWRFGDDFNAALFACACQMSQAGLTEYFPDRGVNYGIMDLSNDKTFEEYQNAYNEFIKIITKKGEAGKFYFGIVPYQLNGRAIICEGAVSKF
uniref:Uncharacterized protein n=1 Tax=Panagrolaimus superbus TaxID=310955 RepID=A0A914YH28_9BILA